MIEGVLFDIDDTLIDTSGSFEAAISALRQEYFPALPATKEREMLAVWYGDAGGYLKKYTTGEIDILTQRIKRADELNQRFGGEPVTPENYTRWEKAFWGTLEQTITLHDDVLPLLAQLKEKGIPVGVVTNAATNVQHRKLRNAGIDVASTFGNAFIGVDTLGFGKPNPEIFLEAAKVLGSTPAHTLYIGDEYTNDAKAAAAAGLVGVWLTRP
ncbi:MAG: HAD family hydrolase, partial [Cellulomonadaceae bacterium]|nr:HAD family hydrolase [Cellulomonadaceae bacterium]